MNQSLRASLHYLGKYINEHKAIIEMEDEEWMTFTVTVKKKSPGVVLFTNPCLTVGVVNTNEVKSDDSVVILNEFSYIEKET